MAVCQKVIYSGHVQGVGFRYTAQRLATAAGVKGYVKNLSDGSVELVVEGEDAHVSMVLERIASEMAGYVHDAQAQPETPQGFRDFRIAM